MPDKLSQKELRGLVVAFVAAADTWVLNYLTAPDLFTDVKLFSIGHAFELYLKAVYTQLTDDSKQAIKLGHNLPKLWKACKSKDPNFLPGLRLPDSHLGIDVLGPGVPTAGLVGDELRHVLIYQELYVIMNHLADLKYIGTPLKSTPGQIAFAFSFPNQIWSQILGEIRQYLGITAPSSYLQCALGEQMPDIIQLNAAGRNFLEHLIRPLDETIGQ